MITKHRPAAALAISVSAHNGTWIFGYITDDYTTTTDGPREVVLVTNMYSPAIWDTQENQIPGLLCGQCIQAGSYPIPRLPVWAA